MLSLKTILQLCAFQWLVPKICRSLEELNPEATSWFSLALRKQSFQGATGGIQKERCFLRGLDLIYVSLINSQMFWLHKKTEVRNNFDNELIVILFIKQNMCFNAFRPTVIAQCTTKWSVSSGTNTLWFQDLNAFYTEWTVFWHSKIPETITLDSQKLTFYRLNDSHF